MSLVQRIVYGSLDLTQAPFLWEFGSDFGSGELVTSVLAQQLQDGEIVSPIRASNRTIELSVLIEDDLSTIAAAEALLSVECGREQNTLTFDPGAGAVTVFDTFANIPVFVRDDDLELNGYRRIKLSIPASPWARSDTAVTETIPAPTSWTSIPCAARRSATVRDVHCTSSPGSLPSRSAYCSAVSR